MGKGWKRSWAGAMSGGARVPLSGRPAAAGLVLAAGLLCAPACAATSDWFLGGSYDGYDATASLVPFDWLAVNNAAGATNVTDAAAWLNGALAGTRAGEAATVRVYWGGTDGGTNRDLWAHTNDFGSVAEGSALTIQVPVESNSVYAYRFYATNAAGEGWASASACFTTPGAPALASGVPVVAMTQASLRGTLLAGVSADVTVFWGQDTNAWANTNALGTVGQGDFSTPASALSEGALYYFRCYGTNDYGEGWSDTAAFTTGIAAPASFSGGSYDGCDRWVGSPVMQTYRGVVISLF